MPKELDANADGRIDTDLLPTTEPLYAPGTLTADLDLNSTLPTALLQRFTVNKASNPLTITLPSDPGPLGKSFVLIVENAAGKTHSWSGSVKWVSEADSDTVPTPAADGYVTVYSFLWEDNDAGTGRWLGWAAGKETA